MAKLEVVHILQRGFNNIHHYKVETCVSGMVQQTQGMIFRKLNFFYIFFHDPSNLLKIVIHHTPGSLSVNLCIYMYI